MPQSLSNVIVHIVFSTKGRQPLIPDAVLPSLHAYLAAICRGEDCVVYEVGGTRDHVHICCALARTICCADLLEKTKKSSSKWLKTRLPTGTPFSWQSGYAVFSVSPSQVADTKRYIATQEEHHRRISFEDEFRALMARHHIAYDERYCWD